MSDPKPIGSGNERGNKGIRVNLDKAHGDYEDHVDMVVPLPMINGADKIRVNSRGEIISQDFGDNLPI